MKIKNKIITISIITITVVVCVIFHFCTAVKIKVDKVETMEYSSIKMTEKEAIQLNSNMKKRLEDSTYFTNYWEISENKGDKYGSIFEMNIHFQLSRYVPLDDYIIGFNVDYSGLDASEKIFFADALGWTEDEYIFQCNGGEEPAPTYISLYGCTYEKDKEEIFNIVKKIKIILVTQDKLGRIKQEKIVLNDMGLSVDEPNENEVEFITNLIK